MRKILEHASAVLSRMIFIGFAIQIGMGILWMIAAFAGINKLGEGLVGVGKLLLFGAASYLFLRACGCVNRGKALFGSLALATFPMVLQCHMTPGIQSATASLMLLETACVLWALRTPEKKLYLSLALAIWLLSGLCAEECLMIGAIPVIFALARRCLDRRFRKRTLLCLLAAVLAAGAIVAARGLLPGRRNITARLSARVVWTTLFDSYDQLPDEWREGMDYDQVIQSTYEPVGLERILLPSLEETMGKENTRTVLKMMMGLTWERNRNKILKEIVWDAGGYALSPVVLPMQLKGKAYSSYSGMNYRRFLDPAPGLGKACMAYGCWWFLASLMIGAGAWILERMRGRGRTEWYGGVMIAAACLGMVVFHTLDGAGNMDYKNTIFILCAWIAWAMSPALREGENGGKEAE